MTENFSSLSKRASSLHLSSSKLADSLKAGSFKALIQGHGIEFSGVRDYLPGDDIRSIDWNVTARFGKPFVKTYEEEKELNIFLIVDRSVSMETGRKKSRENQALETASLILFAGLNISSPVGAVLFDGKIQFSIPPKAGKDQTMLIFSAMDKNPQKTKGSCLANAITGASKILKKRSLVFVISDFRVKGWEKSFALLAAKHDVCAIRISDPDDSKISQIGTIIATDPETGISRMIPTSSKKFQSTWLDNNRKRIEAWKEEVLKRGARPFEISTSEDPLIELLNNYNN